MSECIFCFKGEIAPNAGSVQCTECDKTAFLTTIGKGGTECVCQESTYRANDANRSCLKCRSIGLTECRNKPGSTLSDLKLDAGYWRADSGTVAMTLCPVPKSCNGFARNGSNSSCAAGHHGPLCAVCDLKYTRFGVDSMCEQCPTDFALSVFWTCLASLLAFGCLFLFVKLGRKSHKGLFRPIMNAWQTLSVVLATNSEWPQSVKFVQKYILQTVNFDVISLSSPSCVGAKMNFYHRFIATIIGCSVLVSGPWLLSIMTFIKRKRTPEAGEKWEKAKALRLHDSGLLVLLIYTLVTSQTLYFAKCVGVVSSDLSKKFDANTTMATATSKTTFYLTSDYSLECYDSTWWGMFPLVLVVFCIFSLGVPLGIVMVMRRQKDQLEDMHVKKMWGMLYKPVRIDICVVGIPQ